MRIPPVERRSTDPYLLVVDDEPTVLEVTRAMACVLGWQPLLANSAAHARELFREHADAIGHVLVDLHLPGKSGLELARELHAIAPQVRVDVMTGDAAWARRLSSPPEDVAGVLVKPFSVADLELSLGVQARAA